MGLITYALLVVGGWIAAFVYVSENIKKNISEARTEYKNRTRYSRLTNPDEEGYPWYELVSKTAVIGFIWMFFAIPFALLWKFTWLVVICAALYWKVTWVRTKVDAIWVGVKSLKASLEAKLRG